MTWLGIVLLILVLLAALYVALACPHLPRRPLNKLAGWDYAHRGLWNAERPENSLAAFKAAVDAGYGMELDLHLTTDNVLVVFHDDTLDRMCGVSGRPENCSLAELRKLRLKGTEHGIPTFDEVLEVVNGKAPLIVELKADKRLDELCSHARARLQTYDGPYCIESFHPLAVRWFRKNAPEVIRGQLAYGLHLNQKGKKIHMLDVFIASLIGNALGRPDFIAYDEASDQNLPMGLMRLLRPTLVAWTVRSPERMKQLRKTYDLQIFEGFLPKD